MNDLTGQKFGRLTVESFSHRQPNGAYIWNVVCICGVRKQVAKNNLISNNTRSCGCLKNEICKTKLKTHGLSGTKTHRIWKSMISRCYIPSATGFKNYGARGISVCDRWRKSFVNFLFDMGECPDGFSIDRIDVNGNYEPSNCRWITFSEQQRNRRNNVVLLADVPLSMAQAAKKAGVSYDTIRARRKRGWPDELCVKYGINTKLHAKRITANGLTLTVTEWAKRLNIEPRSIYNRMQSGWTEIEAVTVPKYGVKPQN